MLTKEAKLNNNNANKSPINASATRQLALRVSGFRMRRNWNDVALMPAPLMRYAELTKASDIYSRQKSRQSFLQSYTLPLDLVKN